jgi:hypothetical protein
VIARGSVTQETFRIRCRHPARKLDPNIARWAVRSGLCRSICLKHDQSLHRALLIKKPRVADTTDLHVSPCKLLGLSIESGFLPLGSSWPEKFFDLVVIEM